MPKNKKLPLNSGIQILTNDDEVCIPSLSSILIAVLQVSRHRSLNASKQESIDSTEHNHS